MTLSNGSLVLTPITVDGRQILSQPCIGDTTTLTRWNQSELFSKYEVVRDLYNGRMRLNLWQWDGTPMNPMWLAYSPPQMLPTVTLNPTTSATRKAARDATAMANKHTGDPFSKRQADPGGTMQRSTAKVIIKRQGGLALGIKFSQMFWIAIGMMSIGGLLVFAV